MINLQFEPSSGEFESYLRVAVNENLFLFWFMKNATATNALTFDALVRQFAFEVIEYVGYIVCKISI